MSRLKRFGTNCLKYDILNEVFGTSDLIPMWVADMDLPVPRCVTKALKKRISHPIYGYSIKSESFFRAIENWVLRRHNWQINRDWFVCTPGIVPAINIAVLSLTDIGDEIIIQPPVYPPFFNSITDHQRVVVTNDLKFDGGKYVINYEDLEQKITEKTKMLILCNPHNPVGRVFTDEELIRLGEICMRHNIIILSDEIHADLVYEPYRHHPVAALRKEFEEISITCQAPSKTFNIAGLATSEIIIPNEELRAPFKHLAKSLHICNGNLMGHIALTAAYNQGMPWLDKTMKYLRKNVDYVLEFTERYLPEIHIVNPEGTFLLWLDCRQMKLSQNELVDFFVRNAKLGLNNGADFGKMGIGFMRMNIGCSFKTVKKAMNQLRQAMELRR